MNSTGLFDRACAGASWNQVPVVESPAQLYWSALVGSVCALGPVVSCTARRIADGTEGRLPL